MPGNTMSGAPATARLKSSTDGSIARSETATPMRFLRLLGMETARPSVPRLRPASGRRRNGPNATVRRIRNGGRTIVRQGLRVLERSRPWRSAWASAL